MGRFSLIEWTNHTFNGWRGCVKVSAGCANCYAEAGSKRNPAVLGEWGADANRVVAAESYWDQPFKWDMDAARAGERHRVFALSLGDIFEGRADLAEPRKRLFELVVMTPNLDWLLLTKRAANIAPLASEALGYDVTKSGLPLNVWPGVSVENQEAAEERIPELLKIPSVCPWLSVEPLLGSVDLAAVKHRLGGESFETVNVLHRKDSLNKGKPRQSIAWVVVGGESSSSARPMHPQWARSIRDQCLHRGVPFFFKQWGEWAPRDTPETQAAVNANLRSTHFPQTSVAALRTVLLDNGDAMVRIGKKNAGRLLDGRTWDELPTPREFATS